MQRYAKAITGAVVAGLSTLALGLTDASAAGTDLTGQEWLTAAIAFLVGLGAVWAVPNKPDVPPAP